MRNEDYKKDYEEFWKDLIEVGGALDKDKVMRELHDYRFLLEQVPKAYSHVSGGMISKPNTYAFEVIQQHDQKCQEECDEIVAEETEDLLAERDDALLQNGDLKKYNELLKDSAGKTHSAAQTLVAEFERQRDVALLQVRDLRSALDEINGASGVASTLMYLQKHIKEACDKVPCYALKPKCVHDGGTVPCDYQKPCPDHRCACGRAVANPGDKCLKCQVAEKRVDETVYCTCFPSIPCRVPGHV